MHPALLRLAAAPAVAVLACAGALAATAPQAAAASRDGSCDAGEFCYYRGPGQTGSLSDFTSSVKDVEGLTDPNLCFRFKTPGPGYNECIRNNAVSVWNRTAVPVTVYYSPQYQGTSQTIAPGAKAELADGLRRNNASHRFGTASGTAVTPASTTSVQAISWALYKAPGGEFFAGYDGYGDRRMGRHEGVDVGRSNGSPIYALTEGVVTGVAAGRIGGNGNNASVIAIYMPTTDKTVVYLHATPGVKVGQSIQRGQRIGSESNRGAQGIHTHIEVRKGRRTGPANSMDQTLTNGDPTAWWASQGYAIR